MQYELVMCGQCTLDPISLITTYFQRIKLIMFIGYFYAEKSPFILVGFLMSLLLGLLDFVGVQCHLRSNVCDNNNIFNR